MDKGPEALVSMYPRATADLKVAAFYSVRRLGEGGRLRSRRVWRALKPRQRSGEPLQGRLLRGEPVVRFGVSLAAGSFSSL